MNCLNQAISEERIHQVRLLLSLDVDSELKDKSDMDRSPLIKACLVKHHEPSLRLLKILLKFNVSINAVDSLGRSALHYACYTGKSEVARVLVNEDGIELNTQDYEGRTPLMLACLEGHIAICRMLMGKLVKFDLEIDRRDRQGYTALLLAIKTEHYDIAHDLVRYANACITLRDNEHFLNAAEWLKSNLEKRKAMQNALESPSGRKSRTPRRVAKSPTKQHEASDEKGDEYPGDVPTLTLTESQQGADEPYDSERLETTDRLNSAKSASMLFEADAYGKFSRPPSSGRGAESHGRPPSSTQDNTGRPLTGASVASSTGRFSASSKSRQLQKLEELQEETPETSHLITPFPNPVTASPKRDAGAESTVSFATSRGSRRTWRLDDLESIIEDPHSGQPSRAGGRESVSRSQSRLTSKTPASSGTKSPFYQESARQLQMMAINAEKSAEIYAIQKLKQALRDKSRRKITRASTATFRPASSTSTEQWMSAIISGRQNKTSPRRQNAGKAHVTVLEPPKTSSGQRRKSSINSANADTSSMLSGYDSRKQSAGQIQGSNLAMRLLHATSNLSLDTLISESDVTDSTDYHQFHPKLKNQKNYNQLDTIFRLYTDSCLWTPPVKKPPSLSAQDNVDKEQSEMSDEVGSIIGFEGSTAGSNLTKGRPDSKTATRNRVPGSATSRVSRGSRNAGSAGGRSVTSRHAD